MNREERKTCEEIPNINEVDELLKTFNQAAKTVNRMFSLPISSETLAGALRGLAAKAKILELLLKIKGALPETPPKEADFRMLIQLIFGLPEEGLKLVVEQIDRRIAMLTETASRDLPGGDQAQPPSPSEKPRVQE